MALKTIIVGIAGGTGSGKTTFVKSVVERIESEELVVIQHDSYYKDRSHLSLKEREMLNYDHPDSLDTSLLIDHLKKLVSGQEIFMPTYNFTDHCRNDNLCVVRPSSIIIIEGVLILALEKLCKLLDMKVFIDVDADIRFIRRLQRDVKLRARSIDSVINQYLQTTRPMHDQFVEPSKYRADIIITDVTNKSAIEAVVSSIRSRIE